ncbi:MAG: VWA domain-containing protein [Treponema sp.]|nr:VWA domain-containing protein [Treponema sp.]
MNKKFFFFCLLALAFSEVTMAQKVNEKPSPDLGLTADDVLIERNSGRSIGTSKDGFNLYVRKKDGVQSVLLVEAVKDPLGRETNYAYRAENYNSLNGDEVRLLNGKKLDSDSSRFSLISSTIVHTDRLGDCFLVYIPRKMVFGYPWSRNGTVEISKGTFINIRTFEKKYADYSGKWQDNPFMFDFISQNDSYIDFDDDYNDYEDDEDEVSEEEAVVELTDDYSPVAAERFKEIAQKSRGKMLYSKGPRTLPFDLVNLLDSVKSKVNVDVVFALDTTGSMKDDLEALQKVWIPKLVDQLQEFESTRLGLLLYRDYNDDYYTNGLPVKYFDFTENPNQFKDCLNSVVIHGNEGGDVPEAVFEALYAGLEYYPWRDGAEKCIVLIGDAEPHPLPKGTKKITEDTVMSIARSKDVSIHCIIVPNKLE